MYNHHSAIALSLPMKIAVIWNDQKFSGESQKQTWAHFASEQLSVYKGVVLAEQNVAPALREQRNISAY